MVVLGFVLIIAGAAAIVAAISTADGTVHFLGSDISGLAMFLIGLAAGVAILWGWALTRYGARRAIRRRRERRRLGELSEQLQRREAEERAREADDERS